MPSGSLPDFAIRSRLAGGRDQGLWWPVASPCCRFLLRPSALLLGVWMTGCASDESPPPEADQRPRIDQILSPQGAKPNESYSKRSRYDGQDFKSTSIDKRTFAAASTDGKAREGGKAFNTGGDGQSRFTGQRSRYESEGAREGGQTARTFASRYENQAARTNEFRGARDAYRTSEARESENFYHTGQSRGYSTQTLGATQLSPNAKETASLYPANAAAPLNQDDVRRMLNKAPRER